MDGSIDLILCSVSESNSTVRAVDLKTEQARSILDGNGRLIKTLGKTGSAPASKAETEMLLHHRLQLALYHRALERMESQRPQNERREVVRPAILVGVTGRLVEYPAEMFDSAQSELDTVLQTAARMALTTESPLSEFERRPAEEAQICKTCPFNQGAIPICGPQDE
jgi:RecB family exonuclease